MPDEQPPETPAATGLPRVSIERFLEVDLRVARIVEAAAVEKADRLLRLTVDLGSERRQIVAGIARTYAPQDLIGRLIVVVANLEPARIRGIESQGMLLAAEGAAGPILVTPAQELSPGSRVR